MEEFVGGTQGMDFDPLTGNAAYELIERVLQGSGYRKLSKGEKGVVKRFLEKATGLSRAQITRWITCWGRTRRVKRKAAKRPKFKASYQAQDVRLLAEVDAAHEDLSGPAVRRILKREFEIYGHLEFERLAGISVSHIYNLRQGATYRRIRVRVQHTQARKIDIGERRVPEPKGKPGFIRVDTVHQGNKDGTPGVYHINAVDTVTQWQQVGCVSTICERDLIPVLEAMLHQFPFRVIGFHSDNGSEFINHKVEKLLNKLLVEEFTKSRAYRTTDNALVEGKNGATVRKQMGHGAIAAVHAEAVQKFYTRYFNPYLNFHRPCGFATVTTDEKGKRKRTYRPDDYRTPYEKLISLSQWTRCLKEGITPEFLKRQAGSMSDTEAARIMRSAKLALLAECRPTR